jgi:hypothetical protein
MFDDDQIVSLQFNRSCPICDGFMVLNGIDSEPWSVRTLGERLQFRCTTCGLMQSEWSAISLEAPSSAPDWAAKNERLNSSCRSSRFELHADAVKPAPSRDATPNIAIHLQVELLRKAVGIGDQKQRASRRHVADLADVARAPVMQNDLPDLRSLVSRNKPSFPNSWCSSIWRQQGRCLFGRNKGDQLGAKIIDLAHLKFHLTLL